MISSPWHLRILGLHVLARHLHKLFFTTLHVSLVLPLPLKIRRCHGVEVHLLKQLMVHHLLLCCCRILPFNLLQ